MILSMECPTSPRKSPECMARHLHGAGYWMTAGFDDWCGPKAESPRCAESHPRPLTSNFATTDDQVAPELGQDAAEMIYGDALR